MGERGRITKGQNKGNTHLTKISANLQSSTLILMIVMDFTEKCLEILRNPRFSIHSKQKSQSHHHCMPQFFLINAQTNAIIPQYCLQKYSS